MQTTLHQKTLRRSAQYTIEYNGLRGAAKTFTQHSEFFIHFEDMPYTRHTITVYHKFLIALTFVVSLFTGLIALTLFAPDRSVEQLTVFLSFLGVASILAMSVWVTRKRLTGFSGPANGFLIYANKPSEAEANTFLDQLCQAKVAYLRDMYLKLGSQAPPEEQLRRLLWLREHQAITQQEFEERKHKLLPEPTHQSRVGFAMK